MAKRIGARPADAKRGEHHAKGYVFEVPLPNGLPVQGVVLADHIKSADWRERGSDYIAAVPSAVLDEVRAKLKPLLGM